MWFSLRSSAMSSKTIDFGPWLVWLDQAQGIDPLTWYIIIQTSRFESFLP